MNEFEDIEQLLKPQCEFKASDTLKQEVLEKAREEIHPRRIFKMWPKRRKSQKTCKQNLRQSRKTSVLKRLYRQRLHQPLKGLAGSSRKNPSKSLRKSPFR